MSLFKLRGPLTSRQHTILMIGGIAFILLCWYLLTMGENPLVGPGALPKPLNVFTAFGELFWENDLIKNTARSLGFNVGGYIEAILIAIPLGFVIGLFPFFRGSFQQPVDSIRYVPLPAAIGLFIAWFGIGTGLKVHFLAFGILIYLLPVVVQRIDEVKDVYLKTVYTLGATDWQTIRTVYIPSVISRLSDDIRVLTAISWTYIIIAESIGGEGGIGALIWRVGMRQGRIDKIFALLLLIMFIGVVQDRIFTYLDKEFFPHKYQAKDRYRKEPAVPGIGEAIWTYISSVLVWFSIALYLFLFINEFVPILYRNEFMDIVDGKETFARVHFKVLSYLFGNAVGWIHLIFWSIFIYKIIKIVKGIRARQEAKEMQQSVVSGDSHSQNDE